MVYQLRQAAMRIERELNSDRTEAANERLRDQLRNVYRDSTGRHVVSSWTYRNGSVQAFEHVLDRTEQQRRIYDTLARVAYRGADRTLFGWTADEWCAMYENPAFDRFTLRKVWSMNVEAFFR